jgi:hypothetical protein
MRYYLFLPDGLTQHYPLILYFDTIGLLEAGFTSSAFCWRVSGKCVQRAIFEAMFGSGVK